MVRVHNVAANRDIVKVWAQLTAGDRMDKILLENVDFMAIMELLRKKQVLGQIFTRL